MEFSFVVLLETIIYLRFSNFVALILRKWLHTLVPEVTWRISENPKQNVLLQLPVFCAVGGYRHFGGTHCVHYQVVWVHVQEVLFEPTKINSKSFEIPCRPTKLKTLRS
jgi:hypothetical protein